MPIQERLDLKYSDVTPKRLYMDRRKFLLGLLATGAIVGCSEKSQSPPSGNRTGPVAPKLNSVVNRVQHH